MKKVFYSFFILCFTVQIQAQKTTVIPSTIVGGNAAVAYCENWLPFQNPAALGNVQKIGFALIYENRYITKELANKVLNVWFPTKYINVGGSFSHFGYSEYNEMITALTFARKFSEKFSLGLEFDYYTVYLSASKHYKGAFTTQIGASVAITDEFSLAFNAFNPVFSKIKTEYAEQPLPTVFSIGSLYRIKGTVDWLVQFDKEIATPLRWATGFEYAINEKQFVIRLGAYGYDSFVPTFGAGIRVADFKFDINADYNSVLGFSLIGRLAYEF
ncbi:MAG: hypothetical protein LBT29_07985 [Flavobacteriaceae bacterium]|jgi:hypothetical protein|nr:hypothetical protein [Flavobacteriaceae bacterium]